MVLGASGWGYPTNARKAHYFTSDGRSLCGKWAYTGPLAQLGHPDTDPDDCTACHHFLTRQVQQGSLPPLAYPASVAR
jgi:hypothetical protein